MNSASFVLWQVKIWDRFAKSSPLLLLLLTTAFYLLGFRDWLLFLYVCIGLFVSVTAVWWFWVIYSIASLVHIINNSEKNLTSVIEELKQINQALNHAKDRHNRQR